MASKNDNSPSRGRLEGKKAIVTGGGSGMGRALALAFASEGADVMICGRREDALAETVGRSVGKSGKIKFITCDQAIQEDVKKVVDASMKELGRIDILVNNAGLNIPDRSFEKVSIADFNKVVQINLTGCFYFVHGVLPIMRAQKMGTIINVSSIAGRRAFALAGPAYCASKFGMQSIGDMINAEEGQNGIRCTTISPGEVDTEILDKRPVVPSAEQRAKMMQSEDLAEMAVTVAALPQRCFVPNITMTGITTLQASL
eukprot:gnl/MRDRNA2_/MRDRNA2_79742_c0_seq1.p1 gnl/MRDRNA2_/MRDRNA2_79742_c0~~gnl/MRDRNA2_/MRDRNA2_79742_c0_seq1.p1  ORF type:complete len:258 (+),score=56.51 gnl/MRDRNA2_/MRDRNA2_79742_c0_seq1:85-858(+)